MSGAEAAKSEASAAPRAPNASSAPSAQEGPFDRCLFGYSNYYRNVYPYEGIMRWLTYCGTVDAECREWSYETIISNNETFVSRFKVVRDAAALRQLLSFNPAAASQFIAKLDIGPVYSHALADRKVSAATFVPVQREFVFDIDAGDYDTVRTCCTGAQICRRCWRFMEAAVPVLCLFCAVFGFTRFLFVFSGRRGLHCWIVDEQARGLQKDVRLGMLQLFELVEKDAPSSVKLRYDHANWLCRLVAEHVALPFFRAMYAEQGWLDGDFAALSVASYKDDLGSWSSRAVAAVDRLDLKDCGTGVLRFTKLLTLFRPTDDARRLRAFATALEAFVSKASSADPGAGAESVADYRWRRFEEAFRDVPGVKEAVCVYYTYPRLDIEVTRSMNHLLKIPFSVHLGSTKLSVPLSVRSILRAYRLDEDIIVCHEDRALADTAPYFTPEDACTIFQLEEDPRRFDCYLAIFQEFLDRCIGPAPTSTPAPVPAPAAAATATATEGPA